MHKFYDGKEVPFGKFEDDGEFHIHYDTTSRYGYMAHPIYGVWEGKKYSFRIFVGEAPHKDENGNWVTYNKVPSFYMGSFGGAHCLEEEPDIPHIIDICTDEWRHSQRERDEMERKQENALTWEMNQKIVYCTFGTYLKGLWNRIRRRFGALSRYKGKHCTLYTWRKDDKQLQFVNGWENGDLYFLREDDELLRFTFFKKNGRWGFSREKRKNDHVGCEA